MEGFQFLRRVATTGAALLLAVGIASAASAGSTPKTTGSVGLSNPTQYMSFDAFSSNPVKGSVSYSNFEYAVDGTGVWVPDSFNFLPYAMTVTSFTPTSPTSVTFTGTGDCGCGWVSTFTGTISGSIFTLSMTEINASNPAETYALTANGTIASDGSVSGTWSDNYGGGRTDTFTIADIGHEVFHYVALVQTCSVAAPNATFSYTIPEGIPYAGTVITVAVHNGGTPGAGHDTISFNGGGYEIVSGNLTVFS